MATKRSTDEKAKTKISLSRTTDSPPKKQQRAATASNHSSSSTATTTMTTSTMAPTTTTATENRRQRRQMQLQMQQQNRDKRGFDVRGNEYISIPEYNALNDHCLKDYFSIDTVKQHLHKTCFIDRRGKALDQEPHKQAIQIIERSVHKLSSQKEMLEKEQEFEMKRQLAKRKSEVDFVRRRENYLRMKQEQELRQMNIQYLRSNPEALKSIRSSRSLSPLNFTGSSSGSSGDLKSNRTVSSVGRRGIASFRASSAALSNTIDSIDRKLRQQSAGSSVRNSMSSSTDERSPSVDSFQAEWNDQQARNLSMIQALAPSPIRDRPISNQSRRPSSNNSVTQQQIPSPDTTIIEGNSVEEEYANFDEMDNLDNDATFD